MNKKLIIGSLILAAFVTMALVSFMNSKIDYSDFSGAEKGATVQVIGSWIKERPFEYDSKKNVFSFYMKDKKNNTMKVVYPGAKPNNFEIASQVVVKGKYENRIFQADQILTKCPSKYEGKAEELKQS